MTELKDAQIAGKTLFLGASVKVFLEEITNQAQGKLSKEDCLQSSHMWVGITQPTEGRERKKVGGG